MKIIWADAETGGLDPKLYDMTQFAGVIEIDGKVVETFNIFLRPSSPDRVTPEALKITGKTIEEVMAYPPRREGYAQLISILGKYVDKYNRNDKFYWGGQNARFDQDFCRAFFLEFGDKYFGSWFYPHPLDLITLVIACMMKGHLAGLVNLKLETICNAMEIPLKAHDALEDILATRAAVKQLLEFITPYVAPIARPNPAAVQTIP